jgi:hypothetical protein
MRMYFADQQWKLNPALSANLILTGIWWNVKSVLFEELIFRGVLLYILIKRLGAFKSYHYFSNRFRNLSLVFF